MYQPDPRWALAEQLISQAITQAETHGNKEAETKALILLGILHHKKYLSLSRNPGGTAADARALLDNVLSDELRDLRTLAESRYRQTIEAETIARHGAEVADKVVHRVHGYPGFLRDLLIHVAGGVFIFALGVGAINWLEFAGIKTKVTEWQETVGKTVRDMDRKVESILEKVSK